MEETKDRLKYIDMVKGFSIICIIIGHIFIEEYLLQCIVSSFHVPIFFIISGLLMKYNEEQKGKENLETVIKKNIKSLLIPYIFFCGINIWVYIILGVDGRSIKSLISSTIFMAGIGAIWFIPALFIGKIIFSSILKFKNKLIQFAIIAILTAFSLIGLESINYLFEVVIYRSLLGMMFISIGYYFYDTFKKIEMPVLIIFIILALGFFISYKNGLLELYYLRNNRMLLALFLAIIISFCILILFRKISNIKILSFIGENSLILMSTHQIIYVNLLQALAKLSIIPKVLIFVSLFTIIELTIVYICNKYFPFWVR